MSAQSELDLAFEAAGSAVKDVRTRVVALEAGPSGTGTGTQVSVDGVPVATLDIDSTPDDLTNDTAIVYGAAAMSYQPFSVNSSTAATSGTVYYHKVYVRKATTITNIAHILGAVGVTLTAGQNFVGLYNASGVQLGISADLSSVWATGASLTVPKVIPLVSPVTVQPGIYYVLFLSNGTTPAAFGRTGSSGPVNGLLTAAEGFRWGIVSTAQTALPSSFSLGGTTAYTLPTWWALK